jgi:hypothetical protein
MRKYKKKIQFNLAFVIQKALIDSVWWHQFNHKKSNKAIKKNDMQQ